MRRASKRGDTNSGTRIKLVRLSAGVSRKDFTSTPKGINVNTLAAWEQGKVPLTAKGAESLIEAFKEFGVECSDEWLLYGIQPAPECVQKSAQSSLSDSEHEEWFDEDYAIIMEIKSFRQYNKNSIVLAVSDDTMVPLYNIGDYLGGIETNDISSLVGANCIVDVKDGPTLSRRLTQISPSRYNLSGINLNSTSNDFILKDIQIEKAYHIVWHRRKSPNHDKRTL